jgi:hypothetical protein
LADSPPEISPAFWLYLGITVAAVVELLPNMETPTAFDHSVRFSVPTHQYSIFNRAIAGLPPAFLKFPTIREVFEPTATCKALLQGFRLGRGLW